MNLPDADFAVYFTDDDPVIEAGLDDVDYGEPAEWPEWTDTGRWAHGPAYYPTEADAAWLAANPLPAICGASPEPWTPSAADWADYHEFCREVDERHELQRVERLEDEYRTRYGE